MTTSEFLGEIDAIIQAEPGSTSLDDRLESLHGWDSMAAISFIAMADEKLGISFGVGALASCKTVADLARQCEGKVL